MARAKLVEEGYSSIEIPQEKPRCRGETLGCTSSILDKSNGKDTVVFIADGRFHMEGAMISNPDMNFYKYNPYEKVDYSSIVI